MRQVTPLSYTLQLPLDIMEERLAPQDAVASGALPLHHRVIIQGHRFRNRALATGLRRPSLETTIID